MKAAVIGVLALQGAFAKHMQMLSTLGFKAIEVRKPEELSSCDALIIPGGESTTMMKQMDYINFSGAFQSFASKKPVFGTCAGLILMSQEILADQMRPFNLLDISVERNAFGRQIESFHVDVSVDLGKEKSHSTQAILIRAPRIRRIGAEVRVLASLDGEALLVQQGHHLGATFHPELGNDPAIHKYFTRLIPT